MVRTTRRRTPRGFAAAGVVGLAGCSELAFLGGGGFEPAKWMYDRETVEPGQGTYYAGFARPE